MNHNSGRCNPCKNEREEGYGIPDAPKVRNPAVS